MNLMPILFASKLIWFALRYLIYPLLWYQPLMGVLLLTYFSTMLVL